MTDGEQPALLPRRLLPVANLAEAIDHEQNRLLSAVKRDQMLAEESFLDEDWRIAVIVGDPGLGKSVLLEQLSKRVAQSGKAETSLHLLKQGFDQKSIPAFRSSELGNEAQDLLLFDGFDELASSQIIPFYSSLTELLAANSGLRVVITSRTTFAQRYEGFISSVNARLFLLDRFSEEQIIQYMHSANVNSAVVELAKEWFHLQRGTHIISVPRYLKYICQYLNDPTSNVGNTLPRLHVVFERVVKSALGQEVSTQDMITNPWVAERVLAKLALAMEINQVNSITHDELLTFFDTVSSDLKSYFLEPQVFTELSERLLKFDGVSCSFLDREIQEFLASSEIARLPEPLRALFTLCYDEEARILKPSWFNTLRFLFDRMPRLFADVALFLLSASSIDGKTFYTLDEGFWTTAPRFRSNELPRDAARQLFTNTIDYFRSSKFWLDYDAVFCLASIYSRELEPIIKEWISDLDRLNGQLRVEQSNVARLLGELRAHHPQLVPDQEWKEWLLKIACNKQSDLVAVRTILWALRYFADDTIIEKVSSLTDHNDQFINEALVQVCQTINPEHPIAVSLLIKLVKDKVSGAFRALMSVRSINVLSSIINQIATDDELLDAVLNELTHRSSRDDGAIYKIFSAEVVDQNLHEPLRKLIGAMIPRIGQAHRHEPELLTLCQEFSGSNEPLLLASIRDIAQSEEGEHSWSLSSGMAYFLSSDNHERICQTIKNEFPNRFDDYFYTLLQRDVAHRQNMIKSSSRRRVNSTPLAEEVALPTELVSKIRAFKSKEDFRVVVELSKLLEENKRNNRVLGKAQKAEVLNFIEENIFNRFNPSDGSISLNKDVSHRSWTISSFLGIFGFGVQIFKALDEGSKSFRGKLLTYLPFATDGEKAWLREQIGNLTKDESDEVCQTFIKNEALKAIKLENLLEVSRQLHPGSLQEFFPLLIIDPVVDSYEKRRMISALVDVGATAAQIVELKRQLEKTADQKNHEHIENILIERFQCRATAQARSTALIRRAGVVPKRRGASAFSPTPLESEMWEKEFAAPLLRVSDPSWTDIYSNLLEAGFYLASKGEGFISYADYLWDVVFKFTENLMAHRSYQPFIELERKIVKHFDLEGANWVQGKLAKLRNSYSSVLGKPSSFIAATLQYNACLNALVSPVENPRELVQLVDDCLKNEVASWLVGSGRKLVEGAYSAKSKQREVSIQRVMRAPLLEALNLKRHVNYSFTVIREPQIDDDRRTDLLISYGFVGPCVVELKLSSHADLRSRNIPNTKSFTNLQTYMNGYRSNAGILVVLEDKKIAIAKRKAIKDNFSRIPGVRTVFLELPIMKAPLPRKKSPQVKSKSRNSSKSGWKKTKLRH